ncbi:MAG: RlmE family RNA methyltransferase [Pseudomonadota bacterium]
MFKLDELLTKKRLISAGASVVDLGAAPGGWSARAKEIVGQRGSVLAVDLLDIAPIEDVRILKGDITSTEVITQVVEIVGKNNVDLVLSDMAPNITGIRDADEARFVELIEAVMAVLAYVLKPGGAVILKMFQFPGTDEQIKVLRKMFAEISRIKPEASRKQSKEFYVVARGYKL